jgi:hypothetical protein
MARIIRQGLCAGTLIVLPLLAAPVAGATEVQIRSDPDVGDLYIRDREGERDNIRVEAHEDEKFVLVENRSNQLEPKAGCEAVSAQPSVVRCTIPTISFGIAAVLRGGDDKVKTNLGGYINTAQGNDRVEIEHKAGERKFEDSIITGTGEDVVLADRGSQYVTPGPDDDFIVLGRERDHVFHDRALDGIDELDGGPERDFLHFERHRGSLEVDLAEGLGGPVEEQDILFGFEVVLGGRRDDTLRGTEGEDNLDGGGGEDLVDGRGGDDRVSGGRGVDSIFGGLGADILRSRDDALDMVTDCGEGEDTAYADLEDEPIGCEEVFEH